MLRWIEQFGNAEMLLLLSAHRVILDSSAQTAINVGGGFVIVGGLLLGLPALASWLASSAAVGVTGGAGTVAGMYLERIKAFVGVGGDRVVFGSASKSAARLQSQMLSRGWTEQTVQQTVRYSRITREATNLANNNPATAFFNRDGSYVVIDNITRVVIQVSNRFDPNWIPDPSIINPFIP